MSSETPPRKIRLDQLLVERQLVDSRNKAQALIMSGRVLVNDTPSEKAGVRISEDAEIRIKGKILPYVGRGGEKLAGALLHFSLDVSGLVALDVGASTGGFTDVMLQKGVLKVYAVDVGYNQLVPSLRDDPRVAVLEKTHAANLAAIEFIPPPNFATIDVSFIGLRKILSSVVSVLEGPYSIVALVKPQFELGREYVMKGGVVRSEADQLRAVALVEEYAKTLGLEVAGFVPSVLRGEKKGNQEYFILMHSPRI